MMCELFMYTNESGYIYYIASLLLSNTTIRTSPLEHFWNFKMVGSNINNFLKLVTLMYQLFMLIRVVIITCI